MQKPTLVAVATVTSPGISIARGELSHTLGIMSKPALFGQLGALAMDKKTTQRWLPWTLYGGSNRPRPRTSPGRRVQTIRQTTSHHEFLACHLSPRHHIRRRELALALRPPFGHVIDTGAKQHAELLTLHNNVLEAGAAVESVHRLEMGLHHLACAPEATSSPGVSVFVLTLLVGSHVCVVLAASSKLLITRLTVERE